MDNKVLPMLWLAEKPKDPFHVNIGEAKEYFDKKYGYPVFGCFVHPDQYEKAKGEYPKEENEYLYVCGLRIAPDQYVLPGHYLIVPEGCNGWKTEMFSTP